MAIYFLTFSFYDNVVCFSGKQRAIHSWLFKVHIRYEHICETSNLFIIVVQSVINEI